MNIIVFCFLYFIAMLSYFTMFSCGRTRNTNKIILLVIFTCCGSFTTNETNDTTGFIKLIYPDNFILNSTVIEEVLGTLEEKKRMFSSIIPSNYSMSSSILNAPITLQLGKADNGTQTELISNSTTRKLSEWWNKIYHIVTDNSTEGRRFMHDLMNARDDMTFKTTPKIIPYNKFRTTPRRRNKTSSTKPTTTTTTRSPNYTTGSTPNDGRVIERPGDKFRDAANERFMDFILKFIYQLTNVVMGKMPPPYYIKPRPY